MIKYTTQAKADLDEIIDFLLNEGQNYTKKVLRDIAKTLTLLEKNRLLGKPQDAILLTLRSFPAKKNIIFYIPIEDGIEVFRIIHSSRNIEGLFDDFFDDLESLENQ